MRTLTLCAKLILITMSIFSFKAHSHFSVGIIDTGNHALNVANTIIEYSDRKVENVRVCDLNNYLGCLKFYQKNPVDILNLSIQSTIHNTTKFKEELDALRKLIDLGTIIVIAAGQRDVNTTPDDISYPACYKEISQKIIVVSNTSPHAKNCGLVDIIVEYKRECYKHICMGGTSQSAAQISGKIYKDLVEMKDKAAVFNKYNER